MIQIAIIDIGTGNLRSVHKALEHVATGASIHVTANPESVRRADRVVFPGQGAIANCMQVLASTGLRQAIEEAIVNRPFLGICLGLEALYAYSGEDGGIAGLGALKGTVRHLQSFNGQSNGLLESAGGIRLKIPHMGWNTVNQIRPHPLWHGIQQGSRFYFVHSYCADAQDDSEVAGTTEYGTTFTSAGCRENVFAVQFHPEKSQTVGLTLLKNFTTWGGEA